jgi:hypothetical protein
LGFFVFVFCFSVLKISLLFDTILVDVGMATDFLARFVISVAETAGSGLAMHTLYSCEAVGVRGDLLAARRRFTDFTLLSALAIKHFPKIRPVLPGLPEKKILGLSVPFFLPFFFLFACASWPTLVFSDQASLSLRSSPSAASGYKTLSTPSWHSRLPAAGFRRCCASFSLATNVS